MNTLKIAFCIIALTATMIAAAQNLLVVQAEDGTYNGSTETEHSGYTGTGFVDTENAAGAYLQVEFSIKDAGETTIYIYYAHGKTDDRVASVYVNDELQIDSLSFPPTGSFTTWTTQQAKVTLKAGTNVLKLVALTSGGLVNTDKIEIEGEAGPVQYKLNLTITGGGTVNVSPESTYYDAGSTITLEAVNNDIATFDHWEGALSGSDLTQTLTITQNDTVKACFNKLKSYVYYCSPDGSDETGDGSLEKPFYNLQKAVDLAAEGDTIYLKGGNYSYSTRININTCGSEDNYISIYSVSGERAILDFSTMADADANQGIRLTGSYWHFYGFDIVGAGDNGLLIERNKPTDGTYEDVAALTEQAHDNIIEYCNFYKNRDSGIQMKNLAAYNKIINCDSYYNRDSSDGDADGFAPKLTVGTGNYFYGCRSWQNSDDGWDLYLKCKDDGFPQSMVTTIENCWCWRNGFLADGTESEGNGNGFKLGGSDDKDESHDVVLIRCLSFENLQKGFDQNSNVGNMTLINCTGFATPYTSNSSHYTYRIDGTTLADGKKLIEINNIAVSDGITDRKKSAWALCSMTGGEQYTCNYQLSDTNFVSVDTTGMYATRKSDGSLPDVTFMHIKDGNSLLIDTGTKNENIEFLGNAPDLGCFESEYTRTGKSTLNMAEKMATVYPNPASSAIHVIMHTSVTGNASITLSDITGKKISSQTILPTTASSQPTTLDVSGIEPGTYLLQINNGATSEIQKLIVTR